jgi:hypothetical protein
MPHIVAGNENSLKSAIADIGSANFDYDYPGELNLKPGSELHDSIVHEVLVRARESQSVMSSRYSSWRTMDKVTTTYQYVDDSEKKVQEKDDRRPVSIIFPYTYAIRETLITYLTTAFFQDPIFMYEGVSPDDIPGASLLTLLVRMHCTRNKVPLALHTMFGNSLDYGIAPVSPSWERKYGARIRKIMGSAYDIDGEQIAGETIQDVYRGITYEGNTLDNIDPYKYLPDPNIPSHKVQDCEYIGWWYTTNMMALLREEANDEHRFNVKYVKLLKNKLSFLNTDNSGRNEKQKRPDTSSSTYTSKVDVIPMYVDLIPSEWGLGDSDYPQKWLFEVAADGILIGAEKIDQNHGMYPIANACPDFDGYTPTPISRLEALYGLQHTMDWLFNSHIANVRKAINDMLVIDPWMININDVKDPKAGKLIRLRRPAWGKGKVSDYISQLNVVDVTRGNIADSSYIAEWMQRLSAADDSIMGFMRSGGPDRLTKAEFQGTRGGGLSRLQRMAQVVSYQAMHDLGYFFASHAQQYVTQETYSKILGDLPEKLMSEYDSTGRVKIRPEDLYIEYDVLIRDGSVPGGNFSEAWLELFKTISTDPELRNIFDVPRVFTHIARELGAKDVDSFKKRISQIKPTPMADDQVESEIQKGNIIPTRA